MNGISSRRLGADRLRRVDSDAQAPCYRGLRGTATAAAAATLLLAGCGGGDVELVPVSGVVVKRDVPIEKALVEFVPDSGRSGFGLTEADGTFKIMYGLDKEGVPPGVYRVVITTPKPKDDKKQESEMSEGPPGGRPQMVAQGTAEPFNAEDHDYELKDPVTIVSGEPPPPFAWDLDFVELR